MTKIVVTPETYIRAETDYTFFKAFQQAGYDGRMELSDAHLTPGQIGVGGGLSTSRGETCQVNRSFSKEHGAISSAEHGIRSF